MWRTLLILISIAITLGRAKDAEAQEGKTQDLGSLELNLDSLGPRKSCVYTYSALDRNGNNQIGAGTFTLNTQVRNDTVVLDDAIDATYGDISLTWKSQQTCRRDPFLSPLRIESRGSGDDEARTFILTADNDGAKVDESGRERSFDLPPDTVTFLAFFRIVTLLPREKGTRITFGHWLESSELNLKKEFLAESLGPEALRVEDAEVRCTKFRLDGKGIRTAYYWVDDDDMLQQVLIDGRKRLLLKEKNNNRPANGK